MTEPSNIVLELLSELVEKSDVIYVPVKRKTVSLDDPALPTEAGVRFVRDRLNELLKEGDES